MNFILIRLIFGVLLVTGVSCAQTPPPEPHVPVDQSHYAWLEGISDLPPIERLDEHFKAPQGYDRITVVEESFSGWLRGLPIRLDRSTVQSYDGRPIAAPAEAVIVIDVGKRDLQQCADTILRLHAEYLWSEGLSERAAYHFTSGDLTSFAAWIEGERFVPRGASVERRPGSPRPGDHASYRRWLQQLFIYAGTLSLNRDSHEINGDIQPGDFFVDPGSPGHAVIILDVAVTKDGKRRGLIGQGFTPAQELHVVHSPNALDSVWFLLPAQDGEVLDTPSWSAFPRSSGRRFSHRQE